MLTKMLLVTPEYLERLIIIIIIIIITRVRIQRKWRVFWNVKIKESRHITTNITL